VSFEKADRQHCRERNEFSARCRLQCPLVSSVPEDSAEKTEYTLFILQIEHFTDAGENVPKAARTRPIGKGLTHPKLTLSMPCHRRMLAQCLHANCRLPEGRSTNYFFSMLRSAAEGLNVRNQILASSSTYGFVSRSLSTISHPLHEMGWSFSLRVLLPTDLPDPDVGESAFTSFES
jgi:hypothetical protein